MKQKPSENELKIAEKIVKLAKKVGLDVIFYEVEDAQGYLIFDISRDGKYFHTVGRTDCAFYWIEGFTRCYDLMTGNEDEYKFKNLLNEGKEN